MNKRIPPSLIYLTLIAILLGGLLFRMYKFSNPVADWHSWRQADTASVSYLYQKNGINLLYPRYFDISVIQTGYFNAQGWRFVEFPFFNVAHTVAFNTFGHFTFDEWGRMISIICALTTSFVLFLLGRKLIGSLGGIVSAFVYAVLPYNVYFTRVILPEPMGVMFSMLGLFFGVIYFENFKKRYLFFCSLFFMCALLMKPFFGFYALPLVYLTLKKYGLKKLFKQRSLLLAADFALIPFFLWRGWMNYDNHFIGIPLFGWLFNGDGIRFRPAFWNWIFAERIAKMILGMWGIVPLAIGFMHSVNKQKVIFFSALGMLMYLTVVATANVRHDYYQTMIVPALALCIASGVNWMWNEAPFNALVRRIFVFFSLGMMMLVGWYQVRDFYQVNHMEIILAGEAVQKIVPEDAQIIAPYNGDTAFLYQTKRFGWPVVDRSIEELIDQGADYYVSVNFDTDTNNFMKKFKTVDKTDRYIILDLHQKI